MYTSHQPVLSHKLLRLVVFARLTDWLILKCNITVSTFRVLMVSQRSLLVVLHKMVLCFTAHLSSLVICIQVTHDWNAHDNFLGIRVASVKKMWGWAFANMFLKFKLLSTILLSCIHWSALPCTTGHNTVIHCHWDSESMYMIVS